MNKKNIIVYGDPHGEYAPLIEACAQRTPDAVLILGDMTEPSQQGAAVVPIHERLAPLMERGIDVKWIPGNHEGDNEAQYNATFGSLAAENIHGRVVSILDDKLRVAGLGGVFRGKVWFPSNGLDEEAIHYDQAALLSSLEADELFNGCELPIRHRVSIFRSDVDMLRREKADILVSHEAPSSVSMGFLGIDQLADDLGAKVILHGHHHKAYDEELMNGVRVRGVGQAEVVRIDV